MFYERYIHGRWVVAEGLVYPFVAANPDAYLLRGPTAGMDGRFFVSIDYDTPARAAWGCGACRPTGAVRIQGKLLQSARSSTSA